MAHRHRLVLALGAILTGLPLTGEAVQIAPNPNPAGSTIDIVNDPNAFNALNPFTNEGTINIGGASTLTNQAGARLINEGASSSIDLQASGTLINAGTLDNRGGLSGTTNSTLINSGTMTNTFLHFTGGRVDNSGSLSNTGAMVLQTTGINHNSGVLTNHSLIRIEESPLENSGTFTNNGTITGFAASITNQIGGQLTNTGSMSSGGSLNASVLENNGTVTNAGALEFNNLRNAGVLTNTMGSSLLTTNHPLGEALIHNSGTIINAGSLGSADAGTYIQIAGETINNGTLTQGTVDIQGGSLSGLGMITTPTLTLSSGASLNSGTATQLGTLILNGNLQSSGNLHFRFGGLNAGEFDVLKVNGNALFSGGNLALNFVNGFTAAIGDSWKFLSSSALSGWNSLLVSVHGLAAGLGYEITSVNGAQTLTITGTPVSVPEPSSFLLLGVGLIGLIGFRRKLWAPQPKD